MKNLLIIIPALKKNAVIPDQLIKKLNGITLIQRAINTALNIVDNNHVLVVTDSEEISLICERNKISFYKNEIITLNSKNIIEKISNIIKNRLEKHIILYRANTPLIDSVILKDAYLKFLENEEYILTSVKNIDGIIVELEDKTLISKVKHKNNFKELKAFYIFNRDNILEKKLKPFIVDIEKSIEIESYQDWWICEKVLQRKKIIFNVIGDVKIGMGHIYHSLGLAHEITDHEIIFVCDEKYKIAVDKITAMDYKVISTNNVLSTILDLNPNLIINDILNTDKKYIQILKDKNIKVVNFEDLGEGSQYADLVFNELYDEPQLSGDNYCWGYKYLALRDEFYEATPNSMVDTIDEVLITFGGSDQNNLTLMTLQEILPKCRELNIKINIICGSGYRFKDTLESYIKKYNFTNISLLYESEVVSKIMEKSQLAISSNGRTVYELAHMNIPSIIISHHKREATHSFASLEKGFINLGIFNSSINKTIKEKFEKLVDDKDYRELLFMNIKKFDFSKNKQKVVKKIMELL